MACKTKAHKVENKALAEGMRMLARSGAAGTHGDRRTKRNRDRSSQKRNAIRNNGW